MGSHYQALKERAKFERKFHVKPPPYEAPFIHQPSEADVGDEAVPGSEALIGQFGLLPHWDKAEMLAELVNHFERAMVTYLDHNLFWRGATRIRTCFHHTEGRGNNCVVQPFRRGDLGHFFAYPEDCSQQSPE